MRVWLETNNDPKRKLNYGWRLVELPGGNFATVDTGVANRIVQEGTYSACYPAPGGLPDGAF